MIPRSVDIFFLRILEVGKGGEGLLAGSSQALLDDTKGEEGPRGEV